MLHATALDNHTAFLTAMKVNKPGILPNNGFMNIHLIINAQRYFKN